MGYFEKFVPDEISDEDAAALSPWMSNWSKVSIYLVTTRPPIDVVGKMIRYEINTRARDMIIMRLASNIVSQVRTEFLKEAQKHGSGPRKIKLPARKDYREEAKLFDQV